MDKPQDMGIAVRQNFAITAMKWSPHQPNIFAVGLAQNFGVVGRGFTHIKSIDGPVIKTVAVLDQKDSVFDISWFEHSDQFLLIGSGSGEASFWNINKGRQWVTKLKGQIQSIQCAFKNPTFITGCNNGIINFCTTEGGKILFEIPGHMKNCNEVKWHPSSEKVFASGGGDGCLKMWDHTLPKPNISTIKAHEAEILSLDFNKYEEQIVTASIDKSIRIWDLRNLAMPLNILQHHRYPPKKVRFSPHAPWLLASGSYDMNIHFYDLRDEKEPLKMKGSQHRQFVTGVEFSLFDEKRVCSTAWDRRILIWDWDKPQPILT